MLSPTPIECVLACLLAAAVTMLTAGPVLGQTVPPLFISGDADLSSIRDLLAGAGTPEDPYVLSGLEIVAGGADYGLYFESISVVLIIRGCDISGAAGPHAMGAIVLVNCSRTTVESCRIHSNRIGIKLIDSQGARVVNNWIVGNVWGVALDVLSRGNTLLGNYFDNTINATAAAENSWTEDGRGNCWSTTSCAGGGSITCRLKISAGNVDEAAVSLGACAFGTPASVATRDTAIPAITLIGPPTAVVEVYGTYSDQGASAFDDRDGDITSRIAAQSNLNTSVTGSYQVVYQVADFAGNVALATRKVLVVDQTPPAIRLIGSSVVSAEVKTLYVDPGAEVTDNYDSSVMAKSQSNVDMSRVGTYEVVYQAVDSSGNQAQAIRRTVEVKDSTPPVIRLLGENPMYINIGAPFAEPGVSAWDNMDGDITPRTITGGTVDSSAAGPHVLTYSVSDTSGNVAVPATRTVVVGLVQSMRAGSLTASVEALRITEIASCLSLRIDSGHELSPYQLPLHLLQLLWDWVSPLRRRQSPNLALTIADDEGKLLVATFPNALDPDVGAKSWLELVAGMVCEWVRPGSLIDYSAPPRDAADAQQRVFVMVEMILGPELPARARTVPVARGDGGDLGYQVAVDCNVTSNVSNDALKLAGARDLAAALHSAIILTLGSSAASVSLLFYVDLYGLVYKNDLWLGPATGCSEKPTAETVRGCWVESYVHPLLR